MRLYGTKNNSDSSARYPGGEPSEINSSNLHAAVLRSAASFVGLRCGVQGILYGRSWSGCC